MKITLVSHTLEPEFVAGLGAAICTKSEKFSKSLERAMASGHESVLEHASFTFKLEGVSRALLAQLTRHRIASYSVESQRYVDMGTMECVIPRSIADDEEMLYEYTSLLSLVRNFYHKAVDAGIPKEDARYITPQGACTNLIVTMNARELRHFFALRCCNRAQLEIRAVACEMLGLCKETAPMLFQNAGPECLRRGCPEGSGSCRKPWNGNNTSEAESGGK